MVGRDRLPNERLGDMALPQLSQEQRSQALADSWRHDHHADTPEIR